MAKRTNRASSNKTGSHTSKAGLPTKGLTHTWTEEAIRQLQIIHLSDIHFGNSHNFNPDQSPSGTPMSTLGTKSLQDLLFEDLKNISLGDPHCPTIIVFSGDITTAHDQTGFDQGAEFLGALASTNVWGKVRGNDSVFVVPGNHDVMADAADQTEKMHRWNAMCEKAFGAVRSIGGGDGVEFADCASQGYCVLSINTERYVTKDVDKKYRGEVDEHQLSCITELLRKNEESLERSLRIAVLHHHPVLIPALQEPNRQYDAVLRGGLLLNLLNKYGFHLILHGHKHWPCSFPIDNRNAYDTAFVRPVLIVSGGSIGSKELPRSKNVRNCYNQILIKWNSHTEETRFRVETRGLNTTDESDQHVARSSWQWTTLRVDDRVFYRSERAPKVDLGRPGIAIASSVNPDDQHRVHEYKRLRGNMPVAEVLPSFLPFQMYEVVFWLAQHSGCEPPVKVVWSAGSKFKSITIHSQADRRFAGKYSYFGPMLIEAMLEFEDGTQERAFIYARIPSSHELSAGAT